ncbi:MAG TPA: DUF5980 family protein [Polyangiaceae bacterium]|nr:DUF5980 family protein [Polyangiaceae bacterium]
MKSIHRFNKLSITFVGALAAAVVAGSPAAAKSNAVTASAWTLNDYNQRVCYAPGTGFTYFLVSVTGTWSNPIQWSLSSVPSGWSDYGPGTIPSGSAGPGAVQALAALNISISAAEGDYTIPLTASDGLQTQSVPLLVRIRKGCSGGWPSGMN